MSIPLHLASIKSSGVYRFIWDKSEVPPTVAETLRLVVGYSERGPFNTPVYVNSKSEFINTFGKASKRLERKNVYFHRLADQCLGSGPILAFNLKPFTSEGDNAEKVKVMFGDNLLSGNDLGTDPSDLLVTDLYDTTKFWTLDPDHLAEITSPALSQAYTILSATDSKENSTTVFIRKTPKTYTTNYHMTVRTWFSEEATDEIPSYLEDENIIDTYLDEYFEDIFVFKGQFTNAVKTGALSKYFKKNATPTIDYPTTAEAIAALGDARDELAFAISSTAWASRPETVTGEAGYASDLSSSYGADKDIKPLAATINEDNLEAQYELLADDIAAIEALQASQTEGVPAEVKALLDNISILAAKIIEDEQDLVLFDFEDLDQPDYYDYSLDEDYKNVFNEPADVLLALARDPNSRFLGSYRGILFPYFKDANGSYISLDVVLNDDYDTHKLMMKYNEPLLDAGVTPLTSFEALDYNKWTTDASTGTNTPVYNQGIREQYLLGYDYKTILPTSSAYEILQKSMNVLNVKGIHEALTNRVDVEYHYIIDTFKADAKNNGANDAAEHYKLATLAMDKENAFAMINFPAIKDFGSSVINSTTKTVDMNAVVQKYPLPGESDGASYCAYFTPVLFSDGTLKNVVPSVGLVSNDFMAKYGARQPYYIVAGPTYGRLSAGGLVGPEYGFARSELDILEPAGINAIIYTPRLGTYVNSNQTAKQQPVSALSKIHVRELVIYLTDEIANLLQNYQWELNTQELRDTIKAKADSILETVQNNGGVYDFLNICDSTNNTPEIIDNEMLVLDTHIEPARGAGKMIHQLTIHKTGAISSTIR